MSIYDGTVPNETQDMLEVLASIREDFDAIRTGGNFDFERATIRSTSTVAPVAPLTLAHGTQTAAARVVGWSESAHERLYLTTNARINAANAWERDDTAKSAWLYGLTADAETVSWYRAASGANPIAWTEQMRLHSSGRLELFAVASGGTLKIANNAGMIAPQIGNTYTALLNLCNPTNITHLDTGDGGFLLRRTRASDGAAQNVFSTDNTDRVTFYKDTIRSGQEIGRTGVQMPAGGVGIFAGVYQSFRHKRATAPSSITLTMENSSNASSPAAAYITADGFLFQFQFTGSTGNAFWTGTYATNGRRDHDDQSCFDDCTSRRMQWMRRSQRRERCRVVRGIPARARRYGPSAVRYVRRGDGLAGRAG